MSSVWFDGLDELNTIAVGLGESAARVGARGAEVVRKTAMAVERDGKRFAPVDTGNLRSSISSDIDGDGRHGAMEAVIGPTADYGLYVETGTATQPPQAYMGPAADRNAPGFVAAMAQLAEETL